MGMYFSVGALLGITVVTSFCADCASKFCAPRLTLADLVGSIDEFATQFSVPTAFIGLILLPIVGNAAEHVTAVWMALKGKMELTIGGA